MEGDVASVKISDDSRYALLNRAREKMAGVSFYMFQVLHNMA